MLQRHGTTLLPKRVERAGGLPASGLHLTVSDENTPKVLHPQEQQGPFEARKAHLPGSLGLQTRCHLAERENQNNQDEQGVPGCPLLQVRLRAL